MVESAIYFPFIVLGIMFTIYVTIDMYSVAALRSHLHLAVRAESGRLSGVTDISGVGDGSAYDRYRTAAFAKRISLGEGQSHQKRIATGSASGKYEAGSMAGSVNVEVDARSYAIREISALRAIAGK
jgi:hypothetical protein